MIERHKGPASDWFDRKDALLDGAMSNITVRDVYVAPIKATLQFAVDRGRLSENPAAGVKVRARKAAEERDKRFDGKEAETILSDPAQALRPDQRRDGGGSPMGALDLRLHRRAASTRSRR